MLIGEVTGYIASVLLAVSLIINNDIKFRWLNSSGCVFFIIYGILINAIPIIMTNGILMCINLIHLIRIYRTDENFELIEFRKGDRIIAKFMDFNKKDINKYFPSQESDYVENEQTLSFAVFRDMVIANIFIADIDNAGRARVILNYTVPKFRDFKVGRFLFRNKINYFRQKGIREIYYLKVDNSNHERFLKIIGFVRSTSEECAYKLTVG